MEILLKLLKIDLGITHDKRDTYFNTLIEASIKELALKGINIDRDTAEADEQMLIVDYAAWIYRKRQEDIPISANLQWRIRNRKIKNRCREVVPDE